MDKHFLMAPGLADVLEKYDGFIIDLWGVICDRTGAFPYVYEPLKEMKKQGKKIFFLSNSPHRCAKLHDVVQEKFKIHRDLYTSLFTSGESMYESFHQGHFTQRYHVGTTCFVIDTIPNTQLLEQLGIVKTPNIENADFILALDIFENEEGIQAYTPLMKYAIDLDIPMVCANIDRCVINETGEIFYKPGELFVRYQHMGGRVLHAFGKPNPYMFKRALKELFPIKRDKILVIGDAIATDITGANEMNLDSAFVMGGIHSHEFDQNDDQSLIRFFKHHKMHSTFCIPKFVL